MADVRPETERVVPLKRHWLDMTTEDFADADPARWIAVLPIAAVEQHGPHLPVGVDALIGEAYLAHVMAQLPADAAATFLPMQAIGASDEHRAFRGTLSYSPDTALRTLIDIGESIHRAGLRKLVIVNSHGGNSEVIGIVARELRVRLNMLVATTQWRRFGLPAGLYSAFDSTHGIHAGDIETSLMLHFRADLVDMGKAKRFPSKAAEMEKDYKHLRPAGQHGFGWIAQDLNPDGALGDASAATADKGRLTAEHQADGFIALLRDVARFPLKELA